MKVFACLLTLVAILVVWIEVMKPRIEAKERLEKEQSQRMQPLK